MADLIGLRLLTLRDALDEEGRRGQVLLCGLFTSQARPLLTLDALSCVGWGMQLHTLNYESWLTGPKSLFR
jgi:hypothetical protein